MGLIFGIFIHFKVFFQNVNFFNPNFCWLRRNIAKMVAENQFFCQYHKICWCETKTTIHTWKMIQFPVIWHLNHPCATHGSRVTASGSIKSLPTITTPTWLHYNVTTKLTTGYWSVLIADHEIMRSRDLRWSICADTGCVPLTNWQINFARTLNLYSWRTPGFIIQCSIIIVKFKLNEFKLVDTSRVVFN